jgi:hypothetical protein
MEVNGHLEVQVTLPLEKVPGTHWIGVQRTILLYK